MSAETKPDYRMMQPVLTHVLVHRVPMPEKIRDIIIPEVWHDRKNGPQQTTHRPNEGTVLAVGSEVKDVKVGDVIMWNGAGYVPRPHDLPDYELCDEKQVLVRIPRDATDSH